MGNIFAFMTAEANEISPESEDGGIELRGWIDQEWSMTTLHDSRNDVKPLISIDESDIEALTEGVRDILGDGSLWEDNGDGHFYAKDGRIEDGMSYSYCVMFIRKDAAAGHIETEWHPERDGGISLTLESV